MIHKTIAIALIGLTSLTIGQATAKENTSWQINSAEDWNKNSREHNGLEGLAVENDTIAPTGKEGTYHSKLQRFDSKRTAQAIAIEIEKMSPSRPLTHDLFKTLTLSYQIEVEEVIIYNLVDGIFFAKIICNNGTKTVELDSRTSDAIALAVRYHCPIYTYEHIIESAGILKEEDASEKKKNNDTVGIEENAGNGHNLKTKTLEELQELLNDVLEHEDYMKAIAIRDEINKRK